MVTKVAREGDDFADDTSESAESTRARTNQVGSWAEAWNGRASSDVRTIPNTGCLSRSSAISVAICAAGELVTGVAGVGQVAADDLSGGVCDTTVGWRSNSKAIKVLSAASTRCGPRTTELALNRRCTSKLVSILASNSSDAEHLVVDSAVNDSEGASN